jgi:MFS family permease
VNAEATLDVSISRGRPWILAQHIAGAVLIQSTQSALYATIPIIALRHFDAHGRQSVILTASPVVLISLSIFWNALFQRSPLGRYWALYWLIASVPTALSALAGSFTGFAAGAVASAIGSSGHLPATGELLKRLYPDASRGRVYGILQTFVMLAAAAMTYGVGRWLDADASAFRAFLPAACALQGLGAAVLWSLAHRSGAEAHRHRTVGAGEGALAAALEPLSHMREVLAADNRFARYEAAFMTYGIGWMICNALVPILATAKLHLTYQETAASAYTPYQLALGLCMLPAGLLLDRLGAARATAWSFLALALYPAGLALAASGPQLLAVSLLYGITHAGVNAGWMLGPVSLAPSPAKVPQYIAIHATLVGIRGALFQVLGVYLYEWTGSFTAAFALAAAALLLAGWQMLDLHRRMTTRDA